MPLNLSVNKQTNKKSMTSLENLYYAMGEMAYAVAFSDGEVQKEEREKFQEIITTGLKEHHVEFDVSDIIFQMLEKDKVSSTTVYDWAIKEIKANSHYLSPALKSTFINIIERVAEAFPPITTDEMNLLQRFKKDILSIEGDPVYYEKSL